MPTQSCIKPKIQNISLCPNPEDNLSGYKDYIALALQADVTTMPSRPVYSATITGKDYATAVAATPATAFGSTAVWGKLEVKEGSLKVVTKPKSNFKDSSAVVTEITFEVVDNEDNYGYLMLLSNAPLHTVVEKNNGKMLWCGDAGKAAKLMDVSRENASEKGLISVKIEFGVLSPLYLPSGTTISYVA
ncbi:hypothetical protein VB796_08730 [Arcicella sp. LKC2W]|uniref:hypothetical protein n=1 Tax=Arcicella sp. LKC2W TaxID=2984198 RepID=UPI002B1F74B4|nr:hypothetical protein [Arcicella sp. LKC2W]MEA5459119.1 hypothetical protein [Arcicella sp. LKC2W]